MQTRKLISTVLGAIGCAGVAWAAPPRPTVPGDPGPPTWGHFVERVPPPPLNRIFRAEAEPFDDGNFIESIADDNDQPHGTPWIGVQLAPLPSALSAQLNLDQKGLMVRNVFKNSPADKAGFQRYDVLVKVDGADVTGTVEAFSKSVRNHKTGDTLHFTIIRGAKEMPQDIQLAAAPRGNEMEMKFPEEPDVLFHRDFDLRGHILRPGPNGWEMQDLGDLPQEFQKWFAYRDQPDDGSPRPPGVRTFRRDMKELPTDHARRVGKDGESIDVRRKKDGAIEVRREKRATTGPAESGAQDQISIKVYPNIEELRKDDPKAAELLTAPPALPAPPGRDGMERKGGPRTFNLPAPTPQDPRWREWRERFFRGPFNEGEKFEQPLAGPTPPPNVGFDVQPDGRITVHKRDRDAELNVTYSSRDEFKQKAPDLFKQFEAMEQGIK